MFVQLIEYETDRIDEARKAVDEYREATADRRTATRGMLCEDRDNPGRYVNIVFFPSYEDAMRNSEMPETQKLSQTMMSLSKGEARFVNLEVRSDES